MARSKLIPPDPALVAAALAAERRRRDEAVELKAKRRKPNPQGAQKSSEPLGSKLREPLLVGFVNCPDCGMRVRVAELRKHREARHTGTSRPKLYRQHGRAAEVFLGGLPSLGKRK